MTGFVNSLLIVGAGPAGLALANFLADVVSLRIVERSPHRRSGARASGIQPRIFPLFERLGVWAEVKSRSIELKGNRVRVDGEYCFEVSFVDSKGVCGRSIDQSILESLLEDRLAPKVQVERGVKVVAIQADERSDFAETINERGDEERIESQFIIGCDGGQSIVRKQSGISFNGSTYSELSFTSECDLQCAWLDDGFMYYCVRKDSRLVLVPIPGGKYKVSGEIPKSLESLDPKEAIDVLLQRHMPAMAKVLNVTDFRFYTIHARCAEKLRSRGLLLCGDAAHLFPPNGGQGLNIAIEDAACLSDVLIKFHSSGKSELLDEYATRRLKTAQECLAQIKRTKEAHSYDSLVANHIDSRSEQKRIRNQEL